MNLYFLRHGLAVDRSTPGFKKDADRPLTPKGKQRMWRVAEAMTALELEFDVIFSSPYLRAMQTAEIVAEASDLRRDLVFINALTPDGSPQALIERIKELKAKPKNILLVGHEPYLGKLVSLLTAGSTNLALDLKKGGLCKVEIETLRLGRCGTLTWLLTPKQMLLMV